MKIEDEGFSGVEVIGPEDFSVGKLVTVAGENSPDEPVFQKVQLPNGQSGLVQKEETLSDRVQGEPFMVVNVSYPFIACAHLPDGNPMILDVREHNFVEVDREYASFLVDPPHWQKSEPGGRMRKGEELIAQLEQALQHREEEEQTATEEDGGK